MDTSITATELGRNLSDVLNRIQYRRERFVVRRNGEEIGTFAPSERRFASWRDLLEIVERHPVDEQFADDLEAIQAEQQPVQMAVWPD